MELNLPEGREKILADLKIGKTRIQAKSELGSLTNEYAQTALAVGKYLNDTADLIFKRSAKEPKLRAYAIRLVEIGGGVRGSIRLPHPTLGQKQINEIAKAFNQASRLFSNEHELATLVSLHTFYSKNLSEDQISLADLNDVLPKLHKGARR